MGKHVKSCVIEVLKIFVAYLVFLSGWAVYYKITGDATSMLYEGTVGLLLEGYFISVVIKRVINSRRER